VHPYGSVGDLSKVPFGATRINALGSVDTYRIHKMMAARVTTAW